MSGYDGFAALAIPHDGSGDATDEDRVASRTAARRTYPLAGADGTVGSGSLQSNRAILTVLDAATGRPDARNARVCPGLSNVYASPVAAAGTRLSLRPGRNRGRAGRRGRRRRRTPKVLATNRLAERIDATPAVAGDSLFVRSERSLYRLAELIGSPRREPRCAKRGRLERRRSACASG